MVWQFLSGKRKTRDVKAEPKQEGKKRAAAWPVQQKRPGWCWFPASHRMMAMLHMRMDSTVLPPAIVRKASWRE